MNEILKKLRSGGMAERRPHQEHGRVLSAYLTKKGAKRVSWAHGAVEAIEERMLAGLGRKKRSRLLETLWGCVESLETVRGGER